MDENALLKLALDAGEIMLTSGAETISSIRCTVCARQSLPETKSRESALTSQIFWKFTERL